MPRATRPAARQRPRPDAEICGGEISWRYLSRDGTKQLRTAFDWRMTHTYLSYVCECACRRHQYCQLQITRISARSRFMGSFPTSGATYLWSNVPRSGTTRQRCETTILHPILGSSLPRLL